MLDNKEYQIEKRILPKYLTMANVETLGELKDTKYFDDYLAELEQEVANG
ncbi:hypothetical protein [Cetobacterium somerae]